MVDDNLPEIQSGIIGARGAPYTMLYALQRLSMTGLKFNRC